MEAVWGGVLAFLFILATLSGYGRGIPQIDKTKDKSDQSDKKDEDKEKDKNKEKEKDKNKKEESGKSKDGSSKSKSDNKGRSGQKDKGASTADSNRKVEFCIKDCPGDWRIRQ